MFTLGVDFGTNSVRALVVRCSDGAEFGSRVVDYPSGAQGVLLDPKDGLLARQHPGDYLFGLEESITGALAEAGRKPDFDPSKVVGIGLDSTGSSPIPVDAQNRPLALSDKWRANLDAQCWLWKDHTSWREAARITELCAKLRPQYIAKCGGVYSSEWFWAKLWHCLNVAPETFDAAFSWVELADWAPSVLAGVADPRLVKRGVCAAGHKALYSDDWGGLPDKEFLTALDPRLADLRDRLYEKAYDATEPAGSLCSDWATRLGLAAGHSDRDRRIRRSLRRDRLRRARGHARQGDRHLDLRLRRRFGRKAGRRYSRHLRHRERRHPAGLLRHRSRPVGRRRHFQMVGRGGSGRRRGASRRADRRGGEAASRASRSSGARLEQRQSDHSRRPAAHRPAARPGPLYDAGGHLSRLDRGDRVRGARDHRAHPGIRRAHGPGRVHGRHRREESAAHANLCRRHGLRHAGRGLEPDLRSRLGDRRGGAGGRASGLRQRGGGDDLAEAGILSSRSPRIARSTTSFTPSTASCTTASAD